MFCGHLERVEHLFLLCPFARAVWDTVKEQYQVRLCRKNLVNLKQWLNEFLQRENAINATVLAVTSWHVWEARNEYRNNGIFLPPVRVATRALGYVDMILNFMFKQKSCQATFGGSHGVSLVSAAGELGVHQRGRSPIF
jgi:hypothetical protein